MKISNLLDKDINIVGKKKIFFLIPVAIVVVAAIFMLIYGLTLGSAVNLGMDFTGGYSVSVRLGTKINTANAKDYEKQIVNIIESLEDENGEPYGLKVSDIHQQGNGKDAAFYIKYNAVGDADTMDAVKTTMSDELQATFRVIPTLSLDGNKIVLEYTYAIGTDFNTVQADVQKILTDGGITVTGTEVSENKKSFVITCASVSGVTESMQSELKTVASLPDKYSGLFSGGDSVSASFSSELLWTALAAILASVVLMLVYIAFRFELVSGLSAIVALFHDLVIMFCFMIIFHIEISSTFIAALVTILGYSINNTIVIFDRIRENQKTMFAAGNSAMFIANKSIKETLMRSVNTTLTTLLTIGMVAILGVTDIKIFALPIIVGLLAGTYSSICISPSIWASWKDRKKKDAHTESKKELKKAVAAE